MTSKHVLYTVILVLLSAFSPNQSLAGNINAKECKGLLENEFQYIAELKPDEIRSSISEAFYRSGILYHEYGLYLNSNVGLIRKYEVPLPYRDKQTRLVLNARELIRLFEFAFLGWNRVRFDHMDTLLRDKRDSSGFGIYIDCIGIRKDNVRVFLTENEFKLNWYNTDANPMRPPLRSFRISPQGVFNCAESEEKINEQLNSRYPISSIEISCHRTHFEEWVKEQRFSGTLWRISNPAKVTLQFETERQTYEVPSLVVLDKYNNRSREHARIRGYQEHHKKSAEFNNIRDYIRVATTEQIQNIENQILALSKEKLLIKPNESSRVVLVGFGGSFNSGFKQELPADVSRGAIELLLAEIGERRRQLSAARKLDVNIVFRDSFNHVMKDKNIYFRFSGRSAGTEMTGRNYIIAGMAHSLDGYLQLTNKVIPESGVFELWIESKTPDPKKGVTLLSLTQPYTIDTGMRSIAMIVRQECRRMTETNGQQNLQQATSTKKGSVSKHLISFKIEAPSIKGITAKLNYDYERARASEDVENTRADTHSESKTSDICFPIDSLQVLPGT